MFARLANTVAEALNRRHLPNRIAVHEQRIRDWWKVRNVNGPDAFPREIIRQHCNAIRKLRKSL